MRVAKREALKKGVIFCIQVFEIIPKIGVMSQKSVTKTDLDPPEAKKCYIF